MATHRARSAFPSFVRTASLAVSFGLSGWLGVGCGQKDPAPPAPELSVYHPLVDGSWWEYAHNDWTERVELSAGATADGEPAFTMVDSPNPSDRLRSDSIIASVDGRVVRLAKEEFLVGTGGAEVPTSSVTYGVGFTRFNEDWANQAVGYKETPEYVRVETPPGAPARPAEGRRHTFEIMSLSERVVTGIGTFDCIVIKRTKDWQAEEEGVDLSDAETKTFWFARGVGKVQERNEETMNTEVLIDYSIPGAGG
ncbi:MAG TPA: hypothetical protein VMG12_16910 [Polyangiaceae bacterium]|nr:hypothetical protein [Polyangiaceae bacterium]